MRPRRAPRPRAQRGFSLLEVVLAFVLLAVSLGILTAILGGGLTQVRQAGDASEATLHAQSLIDELGVVAPIAPGRSEGVFERGRYRWRLEVSEAEDPLPPPPGATAPATGDEVLGGPVIYRVQVVVGWGEGTYAREIRFATLRARLPDDAGLGLPP